jgi:hypothetical protein
MAGRVDRRESGSRQMPQLTRSDGDDTLADAAIHPRPRILALLGAALIAVASLLPWHQYDVVMASDGASAARAHGAATLWSVDPTAAVLTAGAAFAAALLLFAAGQHRRPARHLAAAVGLAIAAYAVLRSFDAPALASVMGIVIMLFGAATLVLAALESSASIRTASTGEAAFVLGQHPILDGGR